MICNLLSRNRTTCVVNMSHSAKNGFQMLLHAAILPGMCCSAETPSEPCHTPYMLQQTHKKERQNRPTSMSCLGSWLRLYQEDDPEGGPLLKAEGSFSEKNYVIKSRQGKVVATCARDRYRVGRKALRNRCPVDVYVKYQLLHSIYVATFYLYSYLLCYRYIILYIYQYLLIDHRLFVKMVPTHVKLFRLLGSFMSLLI